MPELRLVLTPARATAAEPAVTSMAEPLPLVSIEQPAGTGAADTNLPLRADGPGDTAPASIPEPSVISVERSDEPIFVVPPASSVPAPVIAASPSASSPQTVPPAPRDAGAQVQARVDAQAQARALAVADLERSELEARRQAEQLEESARVEAARLEAERQEAARLAAARQEAALQEAARQAAARVEATRLEAERQEAARLAAARREEAVREAARQEAARVETALLAAERQETDRREAARRAMGRLLDEEAAQRDAAAAATRLPGALPPSSSGARRGRLFGRTDPNAELILYAEALARKIQLNMTFEMVREAAKRPHVDPVVTLAVRRDGSVESVTFVVSSGVAEIDEAIRRIVQSQLPYQAFPPELAREFDVVEIRRTWHFDTAIRLY